MINKNKKAQMSSLVKIILGLLVLGIISWVLIAKPMEKGGAYSNVGELSKKTGQDSDGDGVTDMLDRCPNIGMKNNVEGVGKNMGCPIKQELTNPVGKSYYVYGGWLLYEGAGGMTEICRAKDGITNVPEDVTAAQLKSNSNVCVGATTT